MTCTSYAGNDFILAELNDDFNCHGLIYIKGIASAENNHTIICFKRQPQQLVMNLNYQFLLLISVMVTLHFTSAAGSKEHGLHKRYHLTEEQYCTNGYNQEYADIGREYIWTWKKIVSSMP